MARKRSRRNRLSYWLLVGGTVLGVAAGISYTVPIPGLTAAVASSGNTTTGTGQDDKPVTDPALQRQQQLDQLETELRDREGRLKTKESEVGTLLQDLTQQKGEADAIRRAATMYENMPPYKAGPLMQVLDQDTAVQILRMLDEDQAAAIIMYMDAAAGAQLMTRLAKPPGTKTGE